MESANFIPVKCWNKEVNILNKSLHILLDAKACSYELTNTFD